jgi:hypothetical protein
MTTNRETQYTELYFPEKLVKDKDEAYSSLLDIDSNFSKFVQSVLKSVRVLSDFIGAFAKNYRHFEWSVVIRDPKTGKVFSIWEKPKHWTNVYEGTEDET